VTTLTAKMLTSVAWLITRSEMNEPITASAPTASGSDAAARLPNTMSSNASRIGADRPSARAIDAFTRSLMSAFTAFGPPTWTVRPLPRAASRIAS
jgi:hypothetical protein